MNSTVQMNKTKKWLQLVMAASLLVSFFLPWVMWDDSKVSGYALATGDFFKISERKLDLSNPFPNISFTFLIFWLIPVLAAVIIFLTATDRKKGLLPSIAGVLSLSLITIYVSFTDFALSTNVLKLMTLAAWLQTAAAIGLIFFTSDGNFLKKIGWIIIGPVFAFGSFKIIEKYIMGETHQDTNKSKADYTLKATDLIGEFSSNDTAANTRYREKIIIVDGVVSQVEVQYDSTVNLKFIDTTKYFINFSIDKTEFEKTKNIKPGDLIFVKGSCSGSSYSMILDSTSIDFKRSTLHKQ